MQNVPYQDCEYPTNLKRNTSPIMILEDKTCKGSYFIETSRVVDNIFFAKFEFTPSLIEIVGVYLSFLMTCPISKYAPLESKQYLLMFVHENTFHVRVYITQRRVLNFFCQTGYTL